MVKGYLSDSFKDTKERTIIKICKFIKKKGFKILGVSSVIAEKIINIVDFLYNSEMKYFCFYDIKEEIKNINILLGNNRM